MSSICSIGKNSETDKQNSSARTLDPAKRKTVAVEALARTRPVTQIARENDISRKLVYALEGKARQALDEAFAPQKDGADVRCWLPVTKLWLRRMVLELILCCHASYRGVQEVLWDTLGEPISTGTIHNIVMDAVAAARRIQAAEDLSGIRVGAHDEIFQAGQPVLVGCDVRSTYCYLLAPEHSRDGTTWGVHLLDLADKGFQPDFTIADAGTGLRAGQAEVLPGTPCRGDTFHADQALGRSSVYLQNRAYGALGACEKLQRKMAGAKKLRQGRAFSSQLAHARAEAEQAVRLADDVAVLEQWMREDVLSLAGANSQVRKEQYDFIVAELRAREQLAPHRIRPVRTMLEHQRDHLLAFAEEQDRRLLAIAGEFQVAPAAIRELFVLQGRPDADPAKWPAEAQLRAKLGGCFHAVLVAVRAVLAQTVRASSVVENLNSRMRDYFFLRDNIGPEYLDLLRFFLNHRRFPASEHPERQGKSPAEILSGKTHPHWLEMLGFPSLEALLLGRAA
jgi:hypothetical protein